MLQRQQADAVVAARQRIVASAVGMVELVLARWAGDELRSTNAQIEFLPRPGRGGTAADRGVAAGRPWSAAKGRP